MNDKGMAAQGRGERQASPMGYTELGLLMDASQPACRALLLLEHTDAPGLRLVPENPVCEALRDWTDGPAGLDLRSFRLADGRLAIAMSDGDELRVRLVARRLLRFFRRPWRVDGRSLHLSAWVGAAIDPNGGGGADALIGQARMALRHARRRGLEGYALFDDTLVASAEDLASLAGELRRALRGDELFLLYQPKLELVSGKVSTVEALVRWQRPGYGVVGANTVVSLAERTGLGAELGAWVLDEACRQLRRWRDLGMYHGGMAVNLSAHELSRAGLPGMVLATLAKHALAPASLVLEVSEEIAMADPEASTLALRKLASLGVRIALDNFGMGESGLLHLQRMPLAELKVDRSLVCDLEHSADSAAMVGAIVAMARAVGARVTAEGVERTAQQARLAELGCDAVQGRLIGWPNPPEALASVLATYRGQQGL